MISQTTPLDLSLRFEPKSLSNAYSWFFYSQNLQRWRRHLKTSRIVQKMVEESVCGLCNASGNVVRSPATFARLLQALDLSKLPPVLTEHRQRIGLCIQCENQIKLLEEAASIRENLKETFVSHLHQLSGKRPYCVRCCQWTGHHCHLLVMSHPQTA